jgi:nucleoside-diphosphate-sugar epimerase
VPEAHERLVANLLDRAALVQALAAAEPDYIVHLAAVAFVAHGDIAELYRTNLLGTVELLQASAGLGGLEKILLASSANIYGNGAELPITEAAPVRAANHYGVSKAAMKQAAALFRELPLVTVRPFNYSGRGQSERFLLPKLAAAYRARQPRIELGNLDVARDFSDVRDVVEAYLRLLETQTAAPVYNICSGSATALGAVVELLNELAGYTIEVAVNPAFVRADEIKVLCGSPARLDAAIGSWRRYTLRETLAWMLEADA